MRLLSRNLTMYAEITPLTIPVTKVKISNSQNVTFSIMLCLNNHVTLFLNAVYNMRNSLIKREARIAKGSTMF